MLPSRSLANRLYNYYQYTSSLNTRTTWSSFHLEKCHGYNRAEAISVALNATRGDQGYNDELEDISDDDTVFDLLEELEELEDVIKN